MAKSKKNKNSETGKQSEKGKKKLREKTLKQDDKRKKPKHEDHMEHIPFKLREIMKSKKRMEVGSSKAKKLKKANSFQCKSNNGDIPVPHFKRRKRESEKSYIQRMDNEARHVLFLTKNQVERRPELAEEEQERPSDQGKSDKKKEYAKMRLQKLHQKKLEKKEDQEEKEMFVDYVPFGEVAVAPPSLSIKPKKAPNKSQAPKELLLNSLLGHSTISTTKPSMARQRLMEEERQRAVEAYRLLKKQKLQQLQAEPANLGKLINLS